MNGIVFGAPTLPTLRAALLSAAPHEAAALLLAGHAGTGHETRLLVREHFLAPPEGYRAQERMRAVLDPSFIMPQLKRARKEGLSLVLTHTHPFSDEACFSPVDDDGERILMPTLFSRTGDCPHGALLLTSKDCSARIWTKQGNSPAHPHPCPIVEVGRDVSFHHRNHHVPQAFPQQFDRSVRALGAEGQALLSSLSVGIIGVGGIGSIVAEELAHLGVGKLLLLDPDVIEETNLNRVVGATRRDIGRSKVEVAAAAVHRMNTTIETIPVAGNVMLADDARHILACDFLFCCTDSHGSRAVVNQIAYQYLIPTIDLGVVVQARAGEVTDITGRVQMLAPGLPCLVCEELLDPEEVRRDLLTDEARSRDPYIVGAAEPQPAVISLNGTVASLAVTMMLSAVAGLPVTARHQVVLFNKGIVRSAAGASSPQCVICSLRGVLARGDTWPMAGRPA